MVKSEIFKEAVKIREDLQRLNSNINNSAELTSGERDMLSEDLTTAYSYIDNTCKAVNEGL